MEISNERKKFIETSFFEFSFDKPDDYLPSFESFEDLNSIEQFYLASIYNWDDGTEVLNWIIESPKCDKGTASLLFWRSEPDYYFLEDEDTISDWALNGYRLIKLILSKFENNEFNRSEIMYDPNDEFYFERYENDIPDWKLPRDLLVPTNGRKLTF